MTSYETEQYCEIILPQRHISALAKFRKGVAPLRISTNRYEGIPEVKRACTFCENSAEDTFLERIMFEALDVHEDIVSIGGRLITNFRFVDDVVVNAEDEEKADVLVDHHQDWSWQNESGDTQPKWLQREIIIQGQSLEAEENFKYLGSLMKDPNLRFFPGLPRQQQLFLDWRSYGGTIISRFLLKLNWCRLSACLPSLFMPLRAGHWQQNSKEGPKPLKLDVIGDLLTLPTKIMWARSCENVSYAICEQQRCRSVCASAQSYQHLCCSLLR